MTRHHLAMVVLVAVGGYAAFKGAGHLFRDSYDPAKTAALMGQARGFALGQRVAAEIPNGGTVIFLNSEPATQELGVAASNVISGFRRGAGKAFQVEHFESPLQQDPNLPDFLQERVIGNGHLSRLPDALAKHSGAVAVVSNIEPASDLPPAANGSGLPPFYVMGFGEDADWEKLLRSGLVKAVLLNRSEGVAAGFTPGKLDQAAEQYYRVIPAR